jgi:inner membrane protease subunit 2
VHTVGGYGRDDIVTFRFAYSSAQLLPRPKLTLINSSPENPKRVLIKRILAIEGDTVKTLPPYPDREVKIPQGHIWVEGINHRLHLLGFFPLTIKLGDEHFVSDDSNRFGPVSPYCSSSRQLL